MRTSSERSEGASRPRDVSPPPPHEPLNDILVRLRKKLSDGVQAQMEVAIEVMRLADNWDLYRSEADGMEISPWLIKYLDSNRPLSWYRKRAAAAKWLGPGHTNRVEADGVVWMYDAGVPDTVLDKVRTEISRAYRDNGKVPLRKSQVVRRFQEFVVKRAPRLRLDQRLRDAEARIVRLEKQVRRLGEEPVE